MLAEKYRQEQEQKKNELDPVVKGVAITGAVGMAMAYQPWGRRASRFLGRVTDTFKSTFKSMERIHQNEAIRYYTKTDFKDLYRATKSNWAASANKVDRLALNTNNNGSLAAYIQSVESTVAAARSMAQETWLRDYVQKDALDQLAQQGFDKATSDNVKSFINKAIGNAENFAQNMQLARQHKLEGQALSFAERISRNIQQRYDAAIKQGQGSDADFITKLQTSVEEEIKKTAYDINTMERVLGTSNNRNIADTATWLLSHAHKMTWGEAKNLGNKLEDATFRTKKDQISIKDKMQEIENTVRQQGGNEAYQRLLKITIDESNLFMTREGNAFSKETSGQVWRDFLSAARNTLPGKLFKVGDIDNALKIPAVQIINLTAKDPVLGAKLKKLGETDKYHFRIGNDIFSLDVNAASGSRVSFNQQLNNGDIKIVSGRYGFFHTQLEALAGQTKTTISDNRIFRVLDIFQDREEYSGNLISNKFSMFFGKNGRAERFGEQLNMSQEYADRWRSAISNLHSFSHNPNANFETDITEETKEFINEYMETQKKTSEIFRTNTYKQNLTTIDTILGSQELNSESRYLFELLQRDNTEEILQALLNPQGTAKLGATSGLGSTSVDFLNNDLRNLLSGVLEHPDITKNKISLVTNELRLSYGTDLINLFKTPMTNTTYTFDDVLRREVAKEAFLRQGFDATTGDLSLKYDRINDLLKSVDLNELNLKEAEKLAQFGIWQYHTRVNTRLPSDNSMYIEYMDRMRLTDELLRGNSNVAKSFQRTYTTVMDDEISWLEGEIASETPGIEALEDYVVINRAASPLDIVKGLNKSIFKRDSSYIKNEVMNVVHGLTANREDLSGANLYTFVPFFTMKRLSDELNRVGLGFSSESTKSTADLAMSFMTKRVLPIALGATYLDWTDDVSRYATGTGLWQGFTAGVANVDLSVRKVLSGLGADEWLRQVKSVNPIWQYWGDKDEYQGYEERLRYYQKGYTPVRKAAWWTWGGVSEARGGAIQYWQPNIVRRAASNYHDMALYDGSMWDKWSHSLIPTPTNPLSPIFALLDPYYLEDAHSEDRPYPVSGPMFTEGTPWGAILNPTIGALIKPEREEHPWRLRNGIDIYNLMYNVNESIRERARDITRTHYITLKGGEVSSVDFNVLTAPLSSSKVISTQFNTENDLPIVQSGTYGIYDTGSRSYSFGSSGNPAIGVYTAGNLGAAPNGGFDQNLASGFNSLADNKKAGLYLLPRSEEITTSEAARQALFGSSDELTKHGDVVVNEKGEIGIYHDRPIEKPKGDKFTQVEKLGINSVISPWARNDKQYILSQIADVNRDFIKSTKERVDSPYAINEDTGFTSGQKLSSFNPSISMELLNDADTVSDLMNQGNGSDFVKNASTSLRLIGGIYGYMGSELVGFGVHNEKTLANSSDMYAFNRGFWDLNLGGAGGAVSEIGRRFIPNFGRLNKVNPLMNEMPDWLPERFRVGDAFAKIPKGEMRLPGKGWETLNELHPDQFGRHNCRSKNVRIAGNSLELELLTMYREVA